MVEALKGQKTKNFCLGAAGEYKALLRYPCGSGTRVADRQEDDGLPGVSKSRVCMDLTGVSLVGPGLGKHEQVVPQWREQVWSLKT